jgi:general secretion pathway protein H
VRARGFTLIEMLVVLLIIGMAMTVVPSLLSSLPGTRLRAAADGMAGTLTALRTQAIDSGRSTALVVDPASRSYAILPDGARRILPDVVNALDVTTTAPIVGSHARLFRFFPDGTATGGTIRLRHGDREESIAVEWLTGRVRRPD